MRHRGGLHTVGRICLMLCTWEHRDGRLVCPNCGKSIHDQGTRRNGERYNPRSRCGGHLRSQNATSFIAPRIGVGETLTRLIRERYHVPPCDLCRETARLMDRLGPAGCRANLQDLAQQLQSNAHARLWTRLLAAAAGLDLAFYASLIIEACEVVEESKTSQDSS
jgi:predicted RNA-binding Zn-ribbon protein involved in translation (DUF1610 family)